MFYSRFLESVNRWPDFVAVQIQRQPGVQPASLFPSSVTTTDDGHVIESYTYSQLRIMAESLGMWLQQQSAPQGARCAILASNSPRWLAVYLGIIGCGHTAVPLDTAFRPDQVAKLLADSGSTYLFVDERNYAVAKEAVGESTVRLALIDGEHDSLPTFEQMLSAGPQGFEPFPAGEDALACLLYTSGTTSDPKGVMLTHGNMIAEMKSAFEFIDINNRDAILGVLPLFHALAQMVNIYFPLGCGAKVVFLDSLSSQELMYALREHGITIFCCVPQFFYLIHERIFSEVAKKPAAARAIFRLMLLLSRISRPFGLNPGKIMFAKVHKLLGSKMRVFVTGGSKFDPAVGRDFHALGFVILQAYGLTETTSGCFCTPEKDNVIGSIGRPIPGVEAKLLDPKRAPDGSGPMIGEILVRGPQVMKGYYNRPDATAEVLKDGWFHTGDLAYMDRRGNYFIAGRAKEIIVLSSGKNIYPDEIEAYYLKSPWIKEICVMGLESSKPGEPLSERLHAVIVPDFDQLRLKKVVNAREVIRYDIESINVHLPATKRILSYDIWQEELPRTTTRKLRRFEIQQKVAALHAKSETQSDDEPEVRTLSDEEREWLGIADVQRGLAIILKTLKNPPSQIHPKDNLELDLGLDSMERVELLVELEHQLGADVEDNAASEVYTVRELIDLVRSKIGQSAGQGAGWDTILATESTDPEVLRIKKKRFFVDRLWYLFGKSVTVMSRIVFRLEIEGREKLPQAPFIICPNHASYLDAPILTAAMPWRVFRRLFYVGTSEIFGSGPMRGLARFLRLIPVDPDANLVPAMRAGAYGLRNDKILVLYPEGERSIDGRPRVFRKGAAILAHHLNVPIVPVAQEGFYEAWPRGRSFQKVSKLKIKIGDPIYPNPDEAPEVAYDRLTSELRERVVEMWTELHGPEKVIARGAGVGNK